MEGLDKDAEYALGMLAQLVEQRTFNPFVVGSIPAHPTKQHKRPCYLKRSRGLFMQELIPR